MQASGKEILTKRSGDEKHVISTPNHNFNHKKYLRSKFEREIHNIQEETAALLPLNSLPPESPNPPQSESPTPPQSESPNPPPPNSPNPPQSESPTPPQSESPTPPQSESPTPPPPNSPNPPQSESPAPSQSESPTPPQSESSTPPQSESPTPPQSESPTPPPLNSPPMNFNIKQENEDIEYNFTSLEYKMWENYKPAQNDNQVEEKPFIKKEDSEEELEEARDTPPTAANLQWNSENDEYLSHNTGTTKTDQSGPTVNMPQVFERGPYREGAVCKTEFLFCRNFQNSETPPIHNNLNQNFKDGNEFKPTEKLKETTEIVTNDESDEDSTVVMCRDYVRGTCTRGTFCIYAHRIILSQLYRIYTFCKDFLNFRCFLVGCRYAHATQSEKEHFYRTGYLPRQATDPKYHRYYRTPTQPARCPRQPWIQGNTPPFKEPLIRLHPVDFSVPPPPVPRLHCRCIGGHYAEAEVEETKPDVFKMESDIKTECQKREWNGFEEVTSSASDYSYGVPPPKQCKIDDFNEFRDQKFDPGVDGVDQINRSFEDNSKATQND